MRGTDCYIVGRPPQGGLMATFDGKGRGSPLDAGCAGLATGLPQWNSFGEAYVQQWTSFG
jgi:hypothetical protein